MINSMTKDEKINPRIINGSRRKELQKEVEEVFEINQLLKQFFQMKKMMAGFRKRFKGLPFNL